VNIRDYSEVKMINTGEQIEVLSQKLRGEIFDSILKLDTWIEMNGWSGYDPYDIKGVKFFLLTQKSKYTNIISNILLNLFPKSIRKIFMVKKDINPKAMALFSRGYFNLYKKFKEERYLDKALYCLNWLVQNSSEGYSGFCWGYPFNWQSRVFIPRGTPSGVVTSIAIHAFLDAYEIMREEEYLNIARSGCDFLLNNLNIDIISEDKLCFSYTPIDNFHVHNANLFSASALLRTFSYSKDKNYKEIGIKAVNFTVSYQNEDGSWYYWAPPDKLLYEIDNYHTGFILECLNIVRRVLKDEFKYEKELTKGLRFYIENLFVNDSIPKFSYKSIFPIDIHSCAQGIITFCELYDFYPQLLNTAYKIAHWTIKNMQDKNGYFYYRKYRYYMNKMPYIRWGQAWMLRSLSYLV